MALQMQEETHEIISSDVMSGNGQIESTIAGASAATGSDVDHGGNTGEASRRDEGIYTEAGTSGKDSASEPEKLEPMQLFAFDAPLELSSEGGCPKRKVKSVVRFESSSHASMGNQCKVGTGFQCPQCSMVCSYDSKVCNQ